jgi:hypothetical protein
MQENDESSSQLQVERHLEPIRSGGGVEAFESTSNFHEPQKKFCSTSAKPPRNQSIYQTDSSRLGHMTELRFQIEAYERGFDVWRPLGAYHKADLVLFNGARYLSIQIKGTHVLRPNKTSYMVHLKNNSGRYTSDQVDFFAVYIAPKNDFYIIPFAEAKGTFEVQAEGKSQLQHLNNWQALWEAK